ncbi:MAG: DEAD/DEAH box helicase, partial [Cyanobacteriota bacterium]|nr:DEAD/DEAH box helicase [Cyanobacteriota bacterium]
MGRCLPDLKDQSGRQRLLSMTHTKAHEDVSCSPEKSASEISSTSADDGLTTATEATNQNNSGDGSVAVAAEACEETEATELVSEFDCFGFSEPLLKTLAEKGYKQPSPIQKAAIPELMLGRDLVGQAQTGTGKTAAFALPLIERLQDHG